MVDPDAAVPEADAGPADTDTGVDPDVGTDPLPPLPVEQTLPIVFVHGFAGSAEQYQSQAMRFVANGYPQERIRGFDHDGAGMDMAGYANGVDQLVDSVRAEFGVDKVFLVGHSRGTMVSSSYLGNAARAAKVAKYVAVDGAGCGAGGIDCVAPTQALFPPQSHVEVCTSAESFAMQYEFFMGEPPQVVDIVRQKGMATISGKAMNFPANTGRAGVTLEIYEVDPATGARLSDTPQDTFPIGPEGDWGPATVNPDKMYELALVDPGGRIHHFYPQRFLRDTHLVRLLSGPSDSPTRLNTNSGPNHAAIIVIRMREWHQQTDPDVLEISTASASGNEDPVDVIPSGVGNGNIALHIHDDAATPGLSSLNPLPYFPAQAFQTGIDVYMPAADPPDGTITVRNIPRGDTSKPQVINVPNWASSGHSITVVFADYAQPVQ